MSDKPEPAALTLEQQCHEITKREVAHLAAQLAAAQGQIEALKHDIERYIHIAAQEATRAEALTQLLQEWLTVELDAYDEEWLEWYSSFEQRVRDALREKGESK